MLVDAINNRTAVNATASTGLDTVVTHLFIEGSPYSDDMRYSGSSRASSARCKR
jgi:hypothetical protein